MYFNKKLSGSFDVQSTSPQSHQSAVMPDLRFSVAIPTYNRRQLVGRAIESALGQSFPPSEVLVIDDGSADGTADLVRKSYPQVKFLRQNENLGVCAARNRALREASMPWVVFLDDDDTLLPDALERIVTKMASITDLNVYPVVQFAHGNGSLKEDFLIMTLIGYLSGALEGDFVPVIQRELFLSKDLAYPEFVRAGESLLWWKIAEETGIPTWVDRVGRVGRDAPTRITSTEYQIEHACEYAELQEYILQEFGPILASEFPRHYEKRRLGAATYRLLSGNRYGARLHIRAALRKRISTSAIALTLISFLPIRVSKRVFSFYRRKSGAWRPSL